ncbi:polysaccharide lyase family 7 protein [Chryseobacterium sp. PMSZPI]|uniref:polysaccharide lyase family 7 protein n=1 Tax=Chryseobacterium sp. PMSZPI TaxID=1033900 RepID=UPI000C33AA81|nr:polysaccharide lyase family 7 protein [Chryseobacterium sp. PMSZPI]PKF75766.1 hypothetical protein CW752_02520 [Chryseobacterium sp. PMSZPI]
MQIFFKTIVHSGLIILFSNILQAQNMYPRVPQTEFNLTDFNLQLPIEKDHSISIIKGTDIAQFSSKNFYFSPQDKSIRLFCSSDGQPTQNSHYPRTELRQAEEWHFEKKHSFKVKMAIMEQPSSGKIIIGQIHGNSKGTEALKIWWNNGQLQAGFKKEVNDKETRVTLLKNVSIGQIFDYSIEQNNLEIKVKIDQQISLFNLGNSWKSESVYFKAGNYLQDNKIPVTSGLVAIYNIELTK